MKIERHGSGEGFPFARSAFRRLIRGKHRNRAHDLNIIGDHIPFLIVARDMHFGSAESAADVFDSSKSFGKQGFERFAFSKSFFEFKSFIADFIVGKALKFRFPGIYLRDKVPIFFEQSRLMRSKELF